MFTDKRVKKFDKLLKRVYKQYRSLGEKSVSGALRQAESRSISIILEGLADEIAEILANRAAIKKPEDEIANAFAHARGAIMRILTLSDIKSGRSSWVSDVFANLGTGKSPRATRVVEKADKSAEAELDFVWKRRR